MEDISSLSDQNLSIEIARYVGDTCETVQNYVEDMNALMPHIFKHRICLNHSTCLGIPTGNVYAGDLNGSIEVMKFHDVKRALAECLLRVLLANTEA